MEKINFAPNDPKFLALYAFNQCVEKNEDVQNRLDEGCGFFVLVGKNPVGEMMVTVTVISPANFQTAMA